ncbi:MAG: class I SAM-dependent methyltransferase [Candidatus Nanoarchaeia archaeon]
MDYSLIAKGYNELYEEEQLEKLNFIKTLLKVKKTDKLLDVGCGTGISTNYFKCKAIGVDPSSEMIKLSKGDLRVACAESLPFKDQSFDIVISITAIQNFTNIKKAVKEMKRVLKPKGKLIITILKRSKKVSEIKLLLKEFKVYEIEKDLVFMKEF